MATRKSIAEQILRIVNGGEVSDDSRIELRDVMPLIDQERDTIIKNEIIDSMYTKGVANSKGELEILGQFLSNETISLIENNSLSKNGILFGSLPNLISLPKDMGVQRVSSVSDDPLLMVKQRRVMSVTVTSPLSSSSTGELLLAGFTNGPLKMDDNYIISFTFNTGDVYTEPKEHKITFNISTKKYKNTIYSWQGLAQAIRASNDFNKFLKDFKLTHTSGGGSSTQSDIILNGLYNYSISNLQINSADSGGSHGFVYTFADTNGFTQNQISDTSLEVVINNTPYTVDFSNEDWGDVLSFSGGGEIASINAQNYIAKAFVLKNAQKIAKEQNILISTDFTGSGQYYGTDGAGNFTPGSPIFIQEIEPKGGFSIDIYSPGVVQAELINGNYVSQLSAGLPSDWGPLNVNGYYPNRFRKPTVFTRMPSSGIYNTLYDKAVVMSGRDYYYIEGKMIYLYGKYSKDDISSIDVSYIASSSSINDSDPYPIPSDYQSIIVKNLVQIFGVMKQAREDMTNDNLK
jgi:hypothetical protein